MTQKAMAVDEYRGIWPKAEKQVSKWMLRGKISIVVVHCKNMLHVSAVGWSNQTSIF